MITITCPILEFLQFAVRSRHSPYLPQLNAVFVIRLCYARILFVTFIFWCQVIRHSPQSFWRFDNLQRHISLPRDSGLFERCCWSRQPGAVRGIFGAFNDDDRWGFPWPQSVRKNDWDISGQRSLQYAAKNVKPVQQVSWFGEDFLLSDICLGTVLFVHISDMIQTSTSIFHKNS